MKIIHLAKSSWPNKGGVEDHVGFVAKEQQKLGHVVEIISLADILASEQPKPNKFLVWNWIWKNRHKFYSADLIQVHDVMWWLLPICAKIRQKTILTFHGWEGVYPVPLRYKIVRFLSSKLASKTVHIGAWIQLYYFDKPDLIAYGGVDSVKISSAKKLSVDEKLKLVFIGRLVKENSIEKYLLFLEELHRLGIDFEITWVGDGEFANQCQTYGKVTGMVDNVSHYIRQADLVLASSYLSILQAQALGKLVIGLADHRLKLDYLEMFPLSSLMIVGTNPQEMAIKLSLFLNDSSLQQKMQRVLAKEIVDYSWKKLAQKYLNLI